ncbi:hypothetical protein [Guptibacillus hwajinpoensis]|uniref:Uncharacterized protein n=1 Tax=Guptibacillus hwajinpoensis TaxID=208199 RepID=A0ABU0JXF6_9BACL|nr:hypothetical protein [Alkalihalobacillus hemicentroti]MDQ0481759.1 hypothetical protein [Alkalihalobacillus hemicentroti]
MSSKPLHYDGSKIYSAPSNELQKEPFKMTDEIRKCISCNPYQLPNEK